MDHQDHIDLIKDGVSGPGGVWADFGSGSGAFTLALAELIGPTGIIHSIDKDSRALHRQKQQLSARFSTTLQLYNSDYTNPLPLPPLDGLIMANTLHFHWVKEPVVQLLRSYLRPDGRFILVEYNSDNGNPWVPYPLTYRHWETVALHSGLTGTRQLRRKPSRLMGAIYSALSFNSGAGGSAHNLTKDNPG